METHTLVGGLFELLGFGITGVSLGQSWVANTRESTGTKLRGGLPLKLRFKARLDAPSPPAFEEMSVEERLELLRIRTERLSQRVGLLRRGLQREKRERKASIARLQGEVVEVEHRSSEALRKAIVEPIPRAALGLGLSVLGFTIQVLGG